MIRQITELRALHAKGNADMGVNGETGELIDCREKYPLWDLYSTKLAAVKTAME